MPSAHSPELPAIRNLFSYGTFGTARIGDLRVPVAPLALSTETATVAASESAPAKESFVHWAGKRTTDAEFAF